MNSQMRIPPIPPTRCIDILIPNINPSNVANHPINNNYLSVISVIDFRGEFRKVYGHKWVDLHPSFLKLCQSIPTYRTPDGIIVYSNLHPLFAFNTQVFNKLRANLIILNNIILQVNRRGCILNILEKTIKLHFSIHEDFSIVIQRYWGITLFIN